MTFDEWIKKPHRNKSKSKYEWLTECVERGDISEVLQMMKEIYYDNFHKGNDDDRTD